MSKKAFLKYEREVDELLGKGNYHDDDLLDERLQTQGSKNVKNFNRSESSEESIEEWVERVQKQKDQKKKEEEVENAYDNERESEKDYPFAPKISMKSRELWESYPQEPIHLRYQTELSKKESKIQKLRKQVEEEERIKEKGLLPLKEGPQTKLHKIEQKIQNERTQKKSRTPSIYERKNIYESGMSWLKNRDSKLAEQQTDRLENELANLQFQPAINKKNNYYSAISKSFEKRQKTFEDQKKLRQAKLEEETYNRYIHGPHINTKSKQLAEKKRMEVEVARKAEILDKLMKDDEMAIYDEENIWKSAPNKKPHQRVDTDTISDFNLSTGNSLPLKKGVGLKKGIHDLKSYQPRISNHIIPKIPDDDFIVSPSSNWSQSKVPKELSKPSTYRKSIGMISPNRVQPPSPKSPAKSALTEPAPAKKFSRSPVRPDDAIRKNSRPSTPDRKTFKKRS